MPTYETFSDNTKVVNVLELFFIQSYLKGFFSSEIQECEQKLCFLLSMHRSRSIRTSTFIWLLESMAIPAILIKNTNLV